ncbi:MAG: SNF2-related protein [Nanoarchaeota archaeon]
MEDIIINENFSNDEEIYFDELERKDIESSDLFDLKIKAEELVKDNEIKEILSYHKIKKNLEYELPHQREGALKILRDMNGTALLADEVGLGKTITAGIVIKESIERGFAKKIMILTPPSLVNQWLAELKSKFELDFKIIENENDWNNSNLVIASIDRVKNYDKESGRFRHYKAHEQSWDLLIVDEAHKLKDKSSVRWKFVDGVQKKRFLILTATPFQNDLFELYNLLHLLKRGHLGTIKEFRDKFLHRGNKRKPLNPHELKKKLNEVMIRRIRSETNVDYKKRMPKIVSVELSKEEFEIYQDVCELLRKQYYSYSGREINGKLIIFAILPKITSSSMAAKESLKRIINDEKYHEKTRKAAFEILHKYEKLSKDSKIEKLIEIIKEIFKNDNQKVLIYTKHPITLKYISEKLKELDLKIVEFLGGQDSEERDKVIKEFRENAQILISTETGSEGLNFQFCNNLINYDLPWNPMSVEQRIGRIDRIGQKKDMNIYSLATKNTMEEHVVDLIINKMCCIGLVIGELPIILFNLGLDEKNKEGIHKIEEMLMESFLDSKNNLEHFAKDVKEINKMIQKGIEDYQKYKDINKKVLDDGK